MVYPQNGGALEITAQIVAGHPWQENDTLSHEVLVLAGPWIRFEDLDQPGCSSSIQNVFGEGDNYDCKSH